MFTFALFVGLRLGVLRYVGLLLVLFGLSVFARVSVNAGLLCCFDALRCG